MSNFRWLGNLKFTWNRFKLYKINWNKGNLGLVSLLLILSLVLFQILMIVATTNARITLNVLMRSMDIDVIVNLATEEPSVNKVNKKHTELF